MKHWKDKSGELDKYVEYWLKKKEFPEITEFDLNILTVFREENEWDKDSGDMIAAKTRCLNARDRDLFGYDFMIVFASNVWQEMNKRQKLRLVWHELYHCRVVFDEDGNAETDKDGRIKTFCAQHDLSIKTFADEIKRFGLSGDQLAIAKFLHEAYLEYKRKEK